MPKILDRLTNQLKAKGFNPGSARAIASGTLQKNGILKKGTNELTAKGKKRDSMTAAERAKDRAARASGNKVKDYNYNPRTNRATLKKKKD